MKIVNLRAARSTILYCRHLVEHGQQVDAARRSRIYRIFHWYFTGDLLEGAA